MEIKYFLGYEQVPHEVFQVEKAKAEEDGNTIKEKRTMDGLPEYVLDNGILIRADGKGNFRRMQRGEPAEDWQVGTEDEYVQGESDGEGKADFFFQVTDRAEKAPR